MDRFKKLIKDFSLKSDIINTVIGIILIISLVFIFLHPKNPVAILIACVSGGLMNGMNGMKMIKDPKRKMMGMSFLMMGVILVVLGFVLTRAMKAA